MGLQSSAANTHHMVSHLKCPLVMFADDVLCWAWWDMKSKWGRRKNKNTESTDWFVLSYTNAHRGQSSCNVQLSRCTELLRLRHPLLVGWVKDTRLIKKHFVSLFQTTTLSFKSTTIKWRFTPLNLFDSYSSWFHMSLRSYIKQHVMAL